MTPQRAPEHRAHAPHRIACVIACGLLFGMIGCDKKESRSGSRRRDSPAVQLEGAMGQTLTNGRFSAKAKDGGRFLEGTYNVGPDSLRRRYEIVISNPTSAALRFHKVTAIVREGSETTYTYSFQNQDKSAFRLDRGQGVTLRATVPQRVVTATSRLVIEMLSGGKQVGKPVSFKMTAGEKTGGP